MSGTVHRVPTTLLLCDYMKYEQTIIKVLMFITVFALIAGQVMNSLAIIQVKKAMARSEQIKR